MTTPKRQGGPDVSSCALSPLSTGAVGSRAENGQNHRGTVLGTLPPLRSSSRPPHLSHSDKSCFSSAGRKQNLDLVKGVYLLCFTSPILVGPLRPSCYNISPSSLRRTKAVPPQQSSLCTFRPSTPPRPPRGTDVSGSSLSEDLWGLSAALALCLPERKPSQQAHLSVSCLFQLPEDCVGWGLGSLSPSSPSLSPSGCCNLWLQPCFVPLAPQGQRSPQNPSSLVGWKPALPLPVQGSLAKLWRARTGGLGLIYCTWHWACTQDFSAPPGEWISHS